MYSTKDHATSDLAADVAPPDDAATYLKRRSGVSQCTSTKGRLHNAPWPA